MEAFAVLLLVFGLIGDCCNILLAMGRRRGGLKRSSPIVLVQIIFYILALLIVLLLANRKTDNFNLNSTFVCLVLTCFILLVCSHVFGLWFIWLEERKAAQKYFLSSYSMIQAFSREHGMSLVTNYEGANRLGLLWKSSIGCECSLELVSELDSANFTVACSAKPPSYLINKFRYSNSLGPFANNDAGELMRSLQYGTEWADQRTDIITSESNTGLTVIIDALKSNDPSQRCAAAFSLAAIGDMQAVVPLANALSDPNVEAWSKSFKALAQIASRGHAVHLELGNTQFASPLIQAASAICGEEDAAFSPALRALSMLMPDGSIAIKNEIAMSLSNIGTRECLAALLNLKRCIGDNFEKSQIPKLKRPPPDG